MVLNACVITETNFIFIAKNWQRFLSHDWPFICGKDGKFCNGKNYEE